MSTCGRACLVLFVLFPAFLGTAAAQDPLADAKALYSNAAYEDALRTLDQVRDTRSLEVHQYRALCLIALDRVEDAKGEIGVVVTADPFFTADPDEFAPRFVGLVNETRRKFLPQLVRRAFGEARALFQEGEHQRARQRFDEVRRLLDDGALSDDPGLPDLKLLTNGFADLMRAEGSSPQTSPETRTGGVTPSATGGPAFVVERRPTAFTPPVAINQTLPPWRPPNDASAIWTYVGAVKVTISASGNVTAAVITRKTHSYYDSAVIKAARGWLYRPATRDGKAVTSELTVEFSLTPRN